MNLNGLFGLDQAIGYLDIRLAIILNMIGLFLKQSKLLNKTENKNGWIPFILIVLGVTFSVAVKREFTYDNIILGIVTGVFSVGGHTSLKNFVIQLMGMGTKEEDKLVPETNHEVVIEESSTHVDTTIKG